MYDEPYLETCCRSALHRLRLCAAVGRPADTRDSGCLHRLVRMGLARVRADGRYEAATTADIPDAAVSAGTPRVAISADTPKAAVSADTPKAAVSADASPGKRLA